MSKIPLLLIVVSASLLASCSSGGNEPPATGPVALASPTTPAPSPSRTPASSAVEIELYVPSVAETPNVASDASGRKRMFVSPGAKSVVATITEPDVQPSPLQNRTEPHDVSPGFNSITLYAPPGTVTIVLRVYSSPDGQGVELGRSDPDDSALQNIVLDGINPVPVTTTIDPIVYAVVMKPTSAAPRAPGCKGTTGQALAVASDGAGFQVYGAGKFLDVNEHYVTYTIEPASPPGVASPDALQRVFPTPLSIGGTVTSGTTALPFAESNPDYDEQSPATYGNYVWYVTLASSTIAGPPAPVPFDGLQCLPGIAG